MDNVNTELPKQEDKRPATWKIIFMVLIVIALIRIFTSTGERTNGGCNCQYEDGAGNKKRTHAMDYKYCRDLLGGEWLGTGADCEVPEYSSH